MMTINNIDDVIEAYRNDDLSTKQVIKILESQTTSIAIWADSEGYNETKEKTLDNLQEYKKYIEKKGFEVPVFFFNGSNSTGDEFRFNDIWKSNK